VCLQVNSYKKINFLLKKNINVFVDDNQKLEKIILYFLLRCFFLHFIKFLLAPH